MGIFSKKSVPPMHSDEYEKLAKRISDLEAEIDKFVAKFMSLRGLVHRKKFEDVPEEPEESEDKKSEDIKDSVLLPNEHGI